MSMRGVIREGRFAPCGDGGEGRGVPECIGRAVCTCEGRAEIRRCGCCTCPEFTAAEMILAKEHGLTIEDAEDMPIEWRAKRGMLGPRSWVLAEGWCQFCRGFERVVGGAGAAICEGCARSVLSLAASQRGRETGRRLVAMPSSSRGSSRGFSGAGDRKPKRANGFEPSTFSLGSILPTDPCPGSAGNAGDPAEGEPGRVTEDDPS